MSIFQQEEYKGDTLLNIKSAGPFLKKILCFFLKDYEVVHNPDVGTCLLVRIPKDNEEQLVTLVKFSDRAYEEAYRAYMNRIAERETHLFNKFSVAKVTRTYKGEIYRGIALVYDRYEKP